MFETWDLFLNSAAIFSWVEMASIVSFAVPQIIASILPYFFPVEIVDNDFEVLFAGW